MPLIKCDLSLILTWSNNFFLVAGTAVNQEQTFTITDTELYVLVVTLLTQDNVKLLKQLELGFKRTINLNKYQSKVTQHARNRYLEILIDLSFHRVNRLFVLSFEDSRVRENYWQYFLLTVEIKD